MIKGKIFSMLSAIAIMALTNTSVLAQMPTPVSQMENLTRGLVSVHKTTGGNFISWRLMGNDPEDITFDLLRDGTTIAKGLTITNYTDDAGTVEHKYRIVTHRTGRPDELSPESKTWETYYKSIRFDRPTGGSFFIEKGRFGTKNGQPVPSADSIVNFGYSIRKAVPADVDGDGQYELMLHWYGVGQDNGNAGLTSNVIYDCYKVNPAVGNEDVSAQRLWRIDLGQNIREGYHYSQPMFFDFNGDGKAEVIMKTGPGSKDALGRYVTEAATDETIKNRTDNETDYRNKQGHILSGPEYLTVFDGQTGRAIHTIWYNPNRGFGTGRVAGYSEAWGDSYGNRGERFLACVAYLDGPDKNPSAVMCRGYYTRAYLWAVDFDGRQLKQKWLHASVSKTKVEVYDADNRRISSKTYSSNTSGVGDIYTVYGQGAHSLAVGDVDGDGCDEIMYGAAAVDNDGQMLYTTGLCHGDAMHLGDFMPDRPGIECMMPHEHSPFGWHVRDAATGELLIYHTSNGDNGRGMAAVMLPDMRGAQFWSAANYSVYNIYDEEIVSGGTRENNKRPNYSFRIYWDGDAYDEPLEGHRLTKWSPATGSSVIFTVPSNSINTGSKGHPVLQADLFGDWREELMWCNSKDSCTLHICSTTTETKFSVPTLMHDHTYRMSICWQHVGYNQPPHLGYYLPDSVAAKFIPLTASKEQTVTVHNAMQELICKWKNCASANIYQTWLNGTRIKSYGVPDGFTFSKDAAAGTFTLGGIPDKEGVYEFLVRASGSYDGMNPTDTIRLHVVADGAGISDNIYKSEESSPTYDISGRQIRQAKGKLPKGLYIIDRKKMIIK